MSTKKEQELFPQTKDLIRIALNDGMTQDQIRRLCRTSQSQVSKWKNGERLAKKNQIKPLLELYGDLLRRVPFKLYQTASTSQEPRQFILVEGKLILRERFQRSKVPQQCQVTACRISVHQQGRDQFVVVAETTRAPFSGKERGADGEPLATDRLAAWHLHNFLGFKVKQVDLQQLRTIAQSNALDDMCEHFPALRQLPFLLTEALLNHGCKLDDLVEFKLAQ